MAEHSGLNPANNGVQHSNECLQFPQQPSNLYGVAVSGKGTIFVSDYSGHKIHVFSKERAYIRSFGSQGSGKSQLLCPCGLTVFNGLVYVANSFTFSVKVFQEDGTFVREIGDPSQLSNPRNVTIRNQQLYVSSASNHRVSVYTLQGQHVRNIGEYGKGQGQLQYPYGVAFSPDGDMYVADSDKPCVQVFDANGQYKREFGQGQLKSPYDIVIAGNGDVFVADSGTNQVAVFSTRENANDLVRSFEVKDPRCVAIDSHGNILVAEHTNKQVVVVPNY